MRIALDLDDSITAHPEFFREMSAGLRARGHEVIVLTFRRDRSNIDATLAELRIVVDDVVHLPEEFSDDHDLFNWKAQRCLDLEVDVAIDDMTHVVNEFSPKTFALMVRDPNRGLLYYD